MLLMDDGGLFLKKKEQNMALKFCGFFEMVVT
jgi:hypothetical protein